MYISLIVNIRSRFSHLYGFELLPLLSQLIETNFFCLYQQNNSCESTVKFKRASNRCKRVLEAAIIAYANKTKESYHFPET